MPTHTRPAHDPERFSTCGWFESSYALAQGLVVRELDACTAQRVWSELMRMAQRAGEPVGAEADQKTGWVIAGFN